MDGITIDDLPDEILNLIFNNLNFHGHLRLSCVCWRFLRLIENDAPFMRTVVFRADADRMLKPQSTHYPTASNLMRTYRNVLFSQYDSFKELQEMATKLLEDAEWFGINDSSIYDTNELSSILKHCKQLKGVSLDKPLKASPEPMEKVQMPVSVEIKNPTCQSLSCFANIRQISVGNWKIKDCSHFLEQHATYVSSMEIIDYVGSELLRLASSTPDLNLKHLSVECFKPNESSHKSRYLELFTRHSSSLILLSVFATRLDQPLLDAIRLNLVNLERLNLKTMDSTDICLNDLKVMPKLKTLSLQFSLFRGYYELNIDELPSLEHLILRQGRSSGLCVKFVSKRPLLTLKKLEFNTEINRQFYQHIVELFPNLTSLTLICGAYDTDFFKVLAQELNKLACLQLLRISICTVSINDGFLSTLRLPNLRRLHMNEERKSFRVSRLGLATLACNCPKLAMITQHDRRNFRAYTVLYKRMRGSGEFRRVRRPVDLGRFEKVDYDSVESCSDEDKP